MKDKSLLMWECGLKLVNNNLRTIGIKSLLMWECGLKRITIGTVTRKRVVTPYVGVWIETRLCTGTDG